jgi:Sulfotransferase family
MSGPVFVLTAHRSGGTALARGLNRHPDLMVWGEHAGFINKLAELDEVIGHYPPLTRPLDQSQLDEHVRRDKFDPGAFDPWRNPFEQADWRDWCRRFIEATFRRGLHPGQRWGFKEVRYHTLATARFLATLFPDASFVILRRELAPLLLSNLLTPWSMEMLRHLGATASEAELRAAVQDCAYALAAVDRGLATIAQAWPDRCRVVRTNALADPVATFAELFAFLGLSQWPALLDEVKEASDRQLGVTDLEGREGNLSRATVLRLLPEALAEAEAALAAGEPDLARLKRLGPTGRYSFLVGDHELVGTPYSSMF